MILLNELLEDFDSNKHKLSEESKVVTESLINYISNTLRFDFDNLTKLLGDKEFKEFSKTYIESGQATDVKQMLSHILNAKITVFSNQIKSEFINLLSVEE